MRITPQLSAPVALALLLSTVASGQAQTAVKIGQIEAQTGPNAIYGWMSSQGAALAVDEINRQGGFTVGGQAHTLQLLALDTRGEPKEATVQLKRLIEIEGAKYIFGPFLSNVFLAVRSYAAELDGKILMWGGATRIHDYVGTSDHAFLMRTWNWDAGPNGFGELMVDLLVKRTGARKIAMLFQNDQGGKVLEDIYVPMFKTKGIEYRLDYFEPGTKDFSTILAKIAAWRPDYLFPGYADSYLYDIVRQAVEGERLRKFFLVRGSLGPGMKNRDGVEDYFVYVPKYFEEAEKTAPKVAKFVQAYKAFYKREFPYDQAPLCSSSCYDHVYMLVEAMKRAGTVDDPVAVKKALMSMTWDGLWRIRFDDKGEAIFNFDVVRLQKGGKLEVIHVNPIK